MNTTNLRRLLEQSSLPDEVPLRVPGPQQHAALEALHQAIQGEGATASLSKWDKREVLSVEPQIAGHSEVFRYRMRESLHISFKDEELGIAPSYSYRSDPPVPLAGLPQLQRIVVAVREKMLGEQRREQKRQKLRKLKERAVEGQIEALARRLGFAYATEPMHAKIKLHIELSSKESLSVDVPHGRAAAVLATLPELIERVRAIEALGIRYAVTQRDRSHAYRRPRPA